MRELTRTAGAAALGLVVGLVTGVGLGRADASGAASYERAAGEDELQSLRAELARLRAAHEADQDRLAVLLGATPGAPPALDLGGALAEGGERLARLEAELRDAKAQGEAALGQAREELAATKAQGEQQLQAAKAQGEQQLQAAKAQGEQQLQAAKAEAERWRREAEQARNEVRSLREEVTRLNETLKTLRPLFGGS